MLKTKISTAFEYFGRHQYRPYNNRNFDNTKILKKHECFWEDNIHVIRIKKTFMEQ